jgi:hypothetical protein
MMESARLKNFKLQLKRKSFFVVASQLIWKIESSADSKKFVCRMLRLQI